MTWICVANPKGGCGKSTLATQLAAILSASGKVVGLYDADPQTSSVEWARRRSAYLPPVNARAVRAPSEIIRGDDDIAIIDTASGQVYQHWVRALQPGDLWLLPVLASPIDVAALAQLTVRPRAGVHYGAVASRINPHTLGWRRLQSELKALDWPLFGWLRDTQQYLHAMQQGLGLLEHQGTANVRDRMQWHALLQECFPSQPAMADLAY